MPTLELNHIGQIEKAKIDFGDLTVFVGAQATGKSIALQFLKLLLDAGHIQRELQRYGIDWRRSKDASTIRKDFFEIYFGEGMHSIWKRNSSVSWNQKSVPLEGRIKKLQKTQEESLFLIPAQRVLALRDGWPRPFTDYLPSDPYAVREFSERLRLEMSNLARGESVFPEKSRLKSEYRRLIRDQVFPGLELQVDSDRPQQRLVLNKDGSNLPYMVWSAGQREFVPLLLGLYWLMPPSNRSRRNKIDWVVLEELEMGLHPKAISTVLLLVLELVHRGYRVVLSTHSPQVLEAVWAIRNLRAAGAPASHLLELFAAKNNNNTREVASSLLSKDAKVYYFNRETGVVEDATDLDAGAEQADGKGWGGLLEFSERANEAVMSAALSAENQK